ncbi:MAG: hypothetical protein JXR94_08500 [Candidatus Hydrogenedentes bacterium]|nr:hypothetical protein [Candidatus Hydrogenedentota bacterium]
MTFICDWLSSIGDFLFDDLGLGEIPIVSNIAYAFYYFFFFLFGCM